MPTRLLFLCGVLLGLTSAACGGTPAAMATATSDLSPLPTLVPTFPIIAIEDFEAGLGLWFPEGDVPLDPNNPGRPVAWSILVSQERAFEGGSSVELFLDGRQGEGAIWLRRPMRVNTESPVKVALTFQLWSEGESSNTLARVATYAGASRPATQAEFDTSEAADRSAGWREYSYGFQVLPQQGSIWVAVGIAVAWETELAYHIDNIRVEITP